MKNEKIAIKMILVEFFFFFFRVAKIINFFRLIKCLIVRLELELNRNVKKKKKRKDKKTEFGNLYKIVKITVVERGGRGECVGDR